MVRYRGARWYCKCGVRVNSKYSFFGLCVLITDMHLEFGKHDYVVDSEMVPQLGQYISKDTFAGCRVGRNGEDALGERWRLSASLAALGISWMCNICCL